MQVSKDSYSRMYTTLKPGLLPQWEELDESEKAKFCAFSNRLGLDIDKNRLVEAMSHRSYSGQGSPLLYSSDRLQVLGANVLGLFTAEFIFSKFPKLPADVLDSVVKNLCSLSTCADVAQVFGIKNVMRWTPVANEFGKTGEQTVSARILEALIGAIYLEKGTLAARTFIHNHFLSRRMNIAAGLNLANSKHTLFQILSKVGKKRPVARLLKETGAGSRTPVYLVGIYSGTDKIGEGYGDSKTMAEERASRNALMQYYLKELQEFELPSDIDESDKVEFEYIEE